MNTRTLLTFVGLSIIGEALLIFAPLAILGAAIGWPASLDLAPAEVLPLIARELSAVRLGYGIYLAYSLAFALVGTAVAWLAVRGTIGERSPLLTLAIALACLSALARAIGIIRWLTASTELSAMPGGESVHAVQLAVNAWGGATGELLGVALLAGMWVAVVSVLILVHGGLPRWLGASGLVVACVVALPAGQLFGVSPASVSVTTTVLHFWLLAAGACAIRQGWRDGEHGR